jgi:hypothetical protein
MKLLFTCILSFVCLAVFAQPNKVQAKKGSIYGKKSTAVGAIEVNTLEEKLATSDVYTGKVKGTVASVCEKKGCWMKLATTEGDGIMIRFKDYKFFMPLNIVGKDVVLTGQAKKTVTSVEMLKHYAEDGGKSKEEIEKITEPKTEIEFIATGVLVVN